MKRLFITLTAAWALIMSAAAMSYTTARDQALFLTDKMAYELDLTGSQYNAAYEINLDYFLSVDRYYDIFGTAWSRRNTDMSYVLTRLQYLTFASIDYFYRPLNWERDNFTFVVYTHYTNRNYFYRDVPSSYHYYQGGKPGHHNNYQGRDYGVVTPPKPKVSHNGGGTKPPVSNRGNGGKPGDNGYKPGVGSNGTHAGNYGHSGNTGHSTGNGKPAGGNNNNNTNRDVSMGGRLPATHAAATTTTTANRAQNRRK